MKPSEAIAKDIDEPKTSGFPSTPESKIKRSENQSPVAAENNFMLPEQQLVGPAINCPSMRCCSKADLLQYQMFQLEKIWKHLWIDEDDDSYRIELIPCEDKDSDDKIETSSLIMSMSICDGESDDEDNMFTIKPSKIEDEEYTLETNLNDSNIKLVQFQIDKSLDEDIIEEDDSPYEDNLQPQILKRQSSNEYFNQSARPVP